MPDKFTNENSCFFEGMTSISALIKAIETNPSARKIKYVYYDSSKASSKYSQIKFLKIKSKEIGFELISAEAEDISNLANGNTHGGFVAVCEEKEYPALSAQNLNPNGIYYIIDGIEDPFNFGYAVRALYAAGADGVILPPRNWTEATAVVCRSSAGCSELLNIYVQDLTEAVRMLKSHGFRIASANITDSVSLYSADLSSPIAFIIGGEKRGISRSLLDCSDLNIRIDYASDFKGSLPTASATALIAFEASKRNGKFNF